MEKIIEIKHCKNCNIKFEITDKDLDLYEKVSPVFGGEKYLIPSPTLCPDCRMQKRMTFRNERNLYKRKCDATGKDIISMYLPNTEYIVYEQNFWLGDKWNAMDYGVDFDFGKSFFNQIDFLLKKVPLPSMYAYFGENSSYCNCVNYQKDCYLTFASSRNENCSYGSYTNDSNYCIDTFMTFNSEKCYQVVDSIKCYNLFFSSNCVDSNNCWYSSNLSNCSNCFGCSNLVGKSYYFENKQYSKEEYNNKIVEVENYIPKKVELQKYITGDMNEDSSGNYIRGCKNVSNSFDVNNLEDCKYNAWFHDSKDCYDTYSWGQNSELCYEGVAIGDNCSSLLFCANVDLNSSNILYSLHCASVKDCFGCIGLKNKQYCIFNKQYTKEEYNTFVPEIINHMKKTGEWGEFFPSSLSPFGYNETVAMEYFPMTKNEILGQPQGYAPTGNENNCRGTSCGYPDKGFNWSDYESPKPNVEKIIGADKLSEKIKDIPDDILNWAIECEVTKKPFRIIKAELDFYRKHNLPIPKRHPDQRHIDRMKLRNSRKLFDRDCDKCGISMKTTYSPEREELVYCEGCYNKEVY